MAAQTPRKRTTTRKRTTGTATRETAAAAPSTPAPATVSSAADFKQKRTENLPIVELPSGLAAKLKRPGMQQFISLGLLPDSLAQEIQRQIKAAQGMSAKQIQMDEKKMIESLLANGDLEDIITMQDRVVAYCVVEPDVQWHRREVEYESEEEGGDPEVGYEVIPDHERDQDTVYTDELDQDDKNFIFQYASGGSSDLTRFRKESAAIMASLEAGQGVESQAE